MTKNGLVEGYLKWQKSWKMIEPRNWVFFLIYISLPPGTLKAAVKTIVIMSATTEQHETKDGLSICHDKNG